MSTTRRSGISGPLGSSANEADSGYKATVTAQRCPRPGGLSRGGASRGSVRMASYVLLRLLYTIPILWGVGTAVFAMMHLLPGDPVAVMLQQSGGSAETLARLRHQLGLDLPVWQQYLI